MDSFFEAFKEAYAKGDGYGLSMTLSPVDTSSQPNRLSSFFRSTNAASAVKDFKYRILYDNSNPFKLTQEEGNGWVEVYFAFWKVAGEILKAEAAAKANEKVWKSSLEKLCFGIFHNFNYFLCPFDSSRDIQPQSSSFSCSHLSLYLYQFLPNKATNEELGIMDKRV